MQVVVSPAAEADIGDAYTRYENQREGLGAEFVSELSSAIDAMSSEPLRFPKIHRTIRRALSHRFPFGVFFVVSDGEVIVLAVLHLARNPRRMRERAPRR
jgi:toxin ParE1/3/4